MKKRFAIISVCIVSILAIGVLAVSSITGWKTLGIAVGQLDTHSSVNSDTINTDKAMSISESEVEKAMMLKQFAYSQNNINKTVTRDEIVTQLTKQKALLSKANALGIAATKDDAQLFMEETKKAFEEGINNGDEGAIKVYENIKQVADGLGMTMDEYWMYSIDEYQIQLTLGNMRQYIVEQHAKETGQTVEQAMESVDVLEKEYVDSLINSGEISITLPAEN